MKLFFALILSFVAVAFTTSATFALESHQLSQHGRWTVTVDVHDDGSLVCSALTTNGNNNFVLSVDQADNYQIFGIVEDGYVNSSEVDFKIRMGNELWDVTDASTQNTKWGVFWNVNMNANQGYEFRQDMMREAVLWLDTEGANVPFSLRGSSRAIQDLEHCRRMIVQGS